MIDETIWLYNVQNTTQIWFHLQLNHLFRVESIDEVGLCRFLLHRVGGKPFILKHLKHCLQDQTVRAEKFRSIQNPSLSTLKGLLSVISSNPLCKALSDEGWIGYRFLLFLNGLFSILISLKKVQLAHF